MINRINSFLTGGGQKYISFAGILVKFPRFLVTNRRGAFYAQE